MNAITLTPLQIDIVRHRLDVPDAIYEALEETYGFNELEVEAAARRLQVWLVTRRCVPLTLSVVEEEVLVDAVDGSTYVAATHSDPETTPRRLSQIIKSGRALAEKLSTVFDRHIVFPIH